MKFYALPRVDGGVEIMQCVDGVTPEDCIAKWSPKRRAEITGEVQKVDPASIPKDRRHREAWRHESGRIKIDAAKKAEIDARLSANNRG